MKKAPKIFAAIALSTTLAMGAAPAFAAEPANSGTASVNSSGNIADDGTGNGKGSASTALNVYLSASQIQATIPIDITVVTPKEGGAITAPSSTAYKIVNNSKTAALKVTQVQGVDNEGWKSVATLSKEVTGEGNIGQLAMTVKAGAAAPQTIESAKATSLDAVQSYFTAPAGGELPLELAGTSVVKADMAGSQTYPAIKISYTVAATAVTPAA